MLHTYSNMTLFHSNTVLWSTASVPAPRMCRLKVATRDYDSFLCSDEVKDRVKKFLDKVQISASSYDTAWVAMVPSPNSSYDPCFPECLDWLLDNQCCDGSWRLPHNNPLLIKDVLLSTLACVLALKRWGLGEEQISKGLHFIESNFIFAKDDKQHSPVGFDIIFPGMIEFAKNLSMNLWLKQEDLDIMLRKRDVEIRRCLESNSEGSRAYLAYVSEGIGRSQDWKDVMKYQRKNGSLLNSPSTTAAALAYIQNDGCLSYLRLLLEKFGNAVPTVYPFSVYARLCMIDSLNRLGIDRHFKEEIGNALEETYRYWLQGKEEIFLEPKTCARAFHILRSNGYDVSSDPLSHFIGEDQYFNSLGGHLKDKGLALDLYKASQVLVNEGESDLEGKASWISQFLKEESSAVHASQPNERNIREVADALSFPWFANLERLAVRRNLDQYDIDDVKILKTSYRYTNIENKDLVKLAVEDFNMCQSVQQEELKHLQRWVAEYQLDTLKFARQKLAYCYFSSAATLPSPELSDARISWAKNGVLTTVVDDFFDVGGSKEELLNLIQLIQKWDVDLRTVCCSEQVQIIFSAIRGTICEIGEKAYTRQGRDVTGHVIEIWLNLVRSMMREAEWLRDKTVPTIDEYMENAYVSFALGPIVLPALYLVGPKLSEETVTSSEYQTLYKLMSTYGRLLNDIQGFKRESAEGKLNAVSLLMAHDSSVNSEEEAVKVIKDILRSQRKELQRLVLRAKSSIVPRACKDLFWGMSKVLTLFYMTSDGFTSNEKMIDSVKAVLYKPIDIGAILSPREESSQMSN